MFAQRIGRLEDMQFVFGASAFEQVPKPGPLLTGVPREVEHDAQSPRQQLEHQWLERRPQPGRKSQEVVDVADLAGKQPREELLSLVPCVPCPFSLVPSPSTPL